MKQPRWLSVAMVTAIHDEAIYEFGGLAGIRDQGLLESAVDRPRNVLGYQPESTLFELAASLGVGIAKNHAFNDGNKRTALLVTRAFLFINGHDFDPAEDDEVHTMVGVADGSIDEAMFSNWLRANSSKLRT
ncbi:MAG TPA: type II toxin-antitoxin system death-on-curing family toxin [Steroidobacteraceae bacterium]|nr:type II toxin-antitoxin system death-on-curing family toxin [Steroidobacteraceae bacterium]